jgi:hypothetical protein
MYNQVLKVVVFRMQAEKPIVNRHQQVTYETIPEGLTTFRQGKDSGLPSSKDKNEIICDEV